MNKKVLISSIIAVCVLAILGVGILAKDTIMAQVSPSGFLAGAFVSTGKTITEEGKEQGIVFLDAEKANKEGTKSDTEIKLLSVSSNGQEQDISEAQGKGTIQILHQSKDKEARVEVNVLDDAKEKVIAGTFYGNDAMMALKLDPFINDFYSIQKESFVEDFNNSIIKKLMELPDLDESFSFEAVDTTEAEEQLQQEFLAIINSGIQNASITSEGKAKIEEEKYFHMKMEIKEEDVKKILSDTYELIMTYPSFKEGFKQGLTTNGYDIDKDPEEAYQTLYNDGKKALEEMGFAQGVTLDFFINSKKNIVQVDLNTTMTVNKDDIDLVGQMAFGKSNYLTDQVKFELKASDTYDELQFLVQSESNFGEKQDEKFQKVTCQLGDQMEDILKLSYQMVYNPATEKDNFSMEVNMEVPDSLVLGFKTNGTMLVDRKASTLSVDLKELKVGFEDSYDKAEAMLQLTSKIGILGEETIQAPEETKDILKMTENELYGIVLEIYGNMMGAQDLLSSY